MKFLIVGLGNIGPEYQLTRHNAGFLLLDRLADSKNTTFEQSRLGYVAKCKHKSRTLHLVKPTTYMNLSGRSVNYWMQEHKIPVENTLIVTDDIALPFGKLRIRIKGSSAGHNGLANIEEVLQTRNYPRLKIGIGNEFSPGGQINYVLSNFNQEEIEAMPSVLDQGCQMIMDFAVLGSTRAMNLHN